MLTGCCVVAGPKIRLFSLRIGCFGQFLNSGFRPQLIDQCIETGVQDISYMDFSLARSRIVSIAFRCQV